MRRAQLAVVLVWLAGCPGPEPQAVALAGAGGDTHGGAGGAGGEGGDGGDAGGGAGGTGGGGGAGGGATCGDGTASAGELCFERLALLGAGVMNLRLPLAGNIDGDSSLELLSHTGTPAFQVFQSSDPGMFDAPAAVPIPTGIKQLCAGYFDGGSTLDVALVSEGGAAYEEIYVHHGFGDGTFDAGALALNVNDPTARLFVGDLDADSRDDLFIVGCDGTCRLYFYKNEGTTFVAGGETDVTPVAQLVVLDADGDGDRDVLTASAADGSIGIVISPMPATSIGMQQDLYAPSGAPASGLAAAAIAPPLVHVVITSATGNEARLLTINTAGLVVDAGSLDFGAPQGSPALADMDGDGALDVVVSASGTVQVARGIGDGTFAAPEVIATASLGPDLHVADLDFDTLPDMLVSAPGGGAGVNLLLSNP